ncbi:MAG: zinc ribbon domain-containing protein [bacterium]|nr:zinc ribbon domain-containing protein [bacterium]
MPLFEFMCRKCDARSEVLVRGSEKPACPECGSTRLVKQASAISPVQGGQPAQAAPAGCGSCCQAQGGGCPYAS